MGVIRLNTDKKMNSVKKQKKKVVYDKDLFNLYIETVARVLEVRPTLFIGSYNLNKIRLADNTVWIKAKT